MEEENHIQLTRREKDILCLIVKGCSTKNISSKLAITTNTVKEYRKRLLDKMNVHNGVELGYKASKLNLV